MIIICKSKNVREEVLYKLDIVAGEEDLLNNYNTTQETVFELIEKIKSGRDITDDEAKLIKGEMKNMLEADESNLYWFTRTAPDNTQAAIARKAVKELKEFLKQFPKDENEDD